MAWFSISLALAVVVAVFQPVSIDRLLYSQWTWPAVRRNYQYRKRAYHNSFQLRCWRFYVSLRFTKTTDLVKLKETVLWTVRSRHSFTYRPVTASLFRVQWAACLISPFKLQISAVPVGSSYDDIATGEGNALLSIASPNTTNYKLAISSLGIWLPVVSHTRIPPSWFLARSCFDKVQHHHDVTNCVCPDKHAGS